MQLNIPGPPASTTENQYGCRPPARALSFDRVTALGLSNDFSIVVLGSCRTVTCRMSFSDSETAYDLHFVYQWCLRFACEYIMMKD